MQTERWEIDSAHSGIHFSVRHMVIARVRGNFARWSGSLESPGPDLSQTTVEVAIDATSIDTGVAERDAHLRSADFLDTANHPEISFRGERVERAGTEGNLDERLRLSGALTIRGVTRPVALDVTYAGRTRDPWGNERAGFTARTSIDRREFGLTWNQALEAGGLLVGERIEIELEVEAVKQAAVQAA